MKSSIILLPAAGLLLVGCATTTGDWEKDSIFFSPSQASQRFARMEARLQFIKGQTESLSAQTDTLGNQLKTSQHEHQAKLQQLTSLQNDISRLEHQANTLSRHFNHTAATHAEMAEMKEKILTLEAEQKRLTVRFAQFQSQPDERTVVGGS